MELRIQEAAKHPANFMYIWADDAFLNSIKPKYAKIISNKKYNQQYLLLLSARKYINKNAQVNDEYYKQYTEAIRTAFIEAYGMTPAKALNVLAAGGTVAGKNWTEGVYGIGALLTGWAGAEVNGETVTCNTNTGHIFIGATDVTDESKTVYKEIGGKTVAFQLFSKDISGDVYMTQYNKLQKKYGAYSWSDDHATYSAKTGAEVTASDSATVWSSVIESIQQFLLWIISLFTGQTQTETISPANTLPSQTEDGFVQEAGFGTAGIIALACVAGGALLYGGKKKKHAQA